MRHAVSTLLVLTGLTLSACTQEATEPGSTAGGGVEAEVESVVVFAAYEDGDYLPTLFNTFTQATGIVVVVRNGEVPGIVDDVIRNDTTPLADVLITPSAYGSWRVAEEGELRPNYSEVVANKVPEWLRDPDKYWVALGYRQAEIVFDPAQTDIAGVATYEDLAAEPWRRKLCLASSSLSINRSVIAMLMRKLGRRDAELAVRGWVANLAQPPFASEAALVQAIVRGDCSVGIVGSGATVGTSLETLVPDSAYIDVEAAGVTRHASNPDAAVRLIEWLVSPDVQKAHAEQTGLLPVSVAAHGGQNAVHAASGAEEATKLAERARYR